jgi:hypothetical protein
MNGSKRWVLFASIAFIVCAVVMNFGPTASSQRKSKGEKLQNPSTPKLENYDIRINPSKETTGKESAPESKGQATVTEESATQLTLELPSQNTTSQVHSQQAVDAVRQSMSAAQGKLAARLGGLKVEYNQVLNVPATVSVDGGRSLATAKSVKGSNEAALRAFMSENAALYGLTQAQASQLKIVSDYTNPAGNLSFVELQQEINGIPVFQGYVRGIVSKDGRLVRTSSLLAAGLSAKSLLTIPTLNAPDAVGAGARSINVTIDANTLKAVASESANTWTVSRGTLSDDTRISLVYFPMAPGNAVLAYAMTLWQPDVAYYVIVDASTGKLLWRKCITQDQTQTATYNIYNNDSPTPSSPTILTAPSAALPPGITRTDVTVVSENPSADLLGWIPDGAGNAVTTGNNVDAGLDVSAPNGIDTNGRATGTGRVFSFPYIPDGAADPTGSNLPTDANYRMGAVTNIFFWSNRYHDQVYNYGFTEAARNFQNDNFSRGGLGGDYVRAEAQDSSGTNNANFSTPADGQLPRMQMYIFTTSPVNRDGDLDADVFLHELTHGTSNRLHANGSGLGSTQSQGMGEGWSDYYARALLATADEDINGIYPAGGYVQKNYYYGIRRFPYAVKSTVGPNGKPHNPLTFADIDPTQINLTDGAYPPAFVGAADEVHNIGEVWCMSLLEMRAQIINSLGFATGNPRSIQIVTDGMKLDPVNPSLLDSRNSILAADCAGYAGADELKIWEGFRLRGMGFRAGVAVGNKIVENFDGPNLTLGNVTVAETAGSSNGNGTVDPGDTVTLTIPLTNTLCATPGTGATATVSGVATPANYGNVAPGQTATQTVTYVVPPETACGSAIPLTITVNSSLGPIVYNYNLRVGQPAALTPYENFDGVTAPALPAGWTSTRSGAGPFWVTSTVNPDTAPNDAFAPNNANAGTAELISPAIPVNTGTAQLSFRNLYNLEDGFDNLTLQIKIGNGGYQDILAAGGSFVTGGYNNPSVGWTGLSAGTTAAPAYITTVVNLPPAANGQIIRLRWQVTSDANTVAPGANGARIDTIQLATTTQNCTPNGVSTVSISGQVTDGTNGVNGIQVTLSGTTSATATTTGNGNYSFPNLVSGGNYVVTPTTPGYEYTPPNYTYNNLTTNVTDANFTLLAAAGISGRVTNGNGQGIDGVTVTLSGTQSAMTTTSGGGFYSFSPLTRFGSYTVTPSGGNNKYSPPSRTYNNLSGPVTGADFTANENLDCVPASAPITGSIAGGDLTQTSRIVRDTIPSTCAGKTYPGENASTAGVSIRYDQYTFTNTTAAPACIKVTLAANFAAHSVAYLTSYDPANKGTNYLGDLGINYAGNNSQASYSFSVPAGATYVVIVTETALNTGGNYVIAFGCGATGTQPTPPAAQPGQVLISEFRQSGPGTTPVAAASANDEFVELYNNTDAPISIGGYGIAVYNTVFGGDVVLGLPAALVIPRRGHLLLVTTAANGYSLSAYAGADLTNSNADLFQSNQGFGLIDASRSVLIDSVGFVGAAGNRPYIEGTGIPVTTNGTRPNVQHSYVRKYDTTGGYPIDTNNNASDFQLVSVTGASFPATPTAVQSLLGAPGPENSTSPIERSALDQPSLVDPTMPRNGGENRVRFFCGDPNAPPCPADANTSTNGYLSIRRKFTNNSGASLTRLRFRIVDITTLGSPGAGAGQAELHAITSTAINPTIMGSPTAIQGTTLEQPPTQTLGGGYNSSLNVDTITLAAPLANGQSVNVQFMLGVKSAGAFRFFVDVEALP